jgi:P27 family predicted phage terminase small subunit
MKKSKAPAHLSRKAKEWWKKIVEEWVLDDAGFLILQSGLEAFDRMVEAQALIKEHGVVAPDRWGQLKTNPAVLVERDCRAAMLAAFKQLHLDLEPLNDRPGRPPGR